jgi:hypothetical protein
VVPWSIERTYSFAILASCSAGEGSTGTAAGDAVPVLVWSGG